MPAEGRDGLWEEKNNWREPKLLWKLDFYWRKAKAWWHEDVYGISNVSWSHDLNRAKHKSLINAELCLTPQVGWERGHQVNVPGCCTCLFGSTSVGRKEKQATLCREGELNLFTILETWWNSQLQTGTKTNKKDTTTQTLGQTVCSDQCHTPPACETRSQNERIQSCINPSCSRPLWLDDRNKNRHTLVSTHTKEKLKRAFLKHSLLFPHILADLHILGISACCGEHWANRNGQSRKNSRGKVDAGSRQVLKHEGVGSDDITAHQKCFLSYVCGGW